MASATTFASSSRIAAAKQTEYVGFLHRHPFATDAHDLGYLTGVREDYNLQTEEFRNVATPVGMLDNDFKKPDLDRYIRRFRRYEPDVAILGDAETKADADRFLDAVVGLREEYPDTTYILVPKSAEALDVLSEARITVGYAMGYSDVQAADFSDPADWRGLDVHLLGASPPKQFEVIETLTQPTVTGAPPANIVGLDWNGPQRVAYLGEYWSRDGWMPADHLSIRETVRKSLKEIRAYWKERGVWPTSTPRDQHGRAVKRPDDIVWAADGSRISSHDDLQDAVVVEYPEGLTLAYRSEKERARIEYRSGFHGGTELSG